MAIVYCCTARVRFWHKRQFVALASIRSLLEVKRTCRDRGRRIDPTRLMLWTAPTLRHQGAIGWLRRNAPLEGSRPWARLARSVSISRSRFFKFTEWTLAAR